MPPQPRRRPYGWPDFLLDVLAVMLVGAFILAILVAFPATLRIIQEAAWSDMLRFRAWQGRSATEADRWEQASLPKPWRPEHATPADRPRYIYRRSEAMKGWQQLQPGDYPPPNAPPLTGQELLDVVKALMSLSPAEMDRLFDAPGNRGQSSTSNGTRTIYLRPVRPPPST